MRDSRGAGQPAVKVAAAAVSEVSSKDTAAVKHVQVLQNVVSGK